MNRTVLARAASVVALSCIGTLSPAQEAPTAGFGETVEVRVVNVDVAVTDKDGVPVTGLDKSDFRIEIDGKPVEITNFASVAATGAAAAIPLPAAPASPAAPPLSPATPAPAPKPEEDTRLRLAVWIDDLHTLPAHRNRILKQLGNLLAEREKAGADILLARFDRSLEVVRNFGAGRPLADDIAQLAKRPASGVFVEAARRSAFEEIDSIYAMDQCGRVGDMTLAANRYAEPLRHDSLIAMRALEGAARSLAGLPGRRVLIYVSDGVPLIPGQEAYLYVDQICGGTEASQPKETLVSDLRRISEEANAAGVTFYTLQAGGLPVGGGAALTGRGLDSSNEFAARGNLQDTLQQMASATGGRALLDANRLEPLFNGLRRDLESGYSLGFSPGGPPDGKEHRIEVKVTRPGLRVRHREAFRDRTVAEQRDGRLLAALRFGGSGNPMGIRLEIDAPKEGDGKIALVPVRVVVPAKSVLFLGTAAQGAQAGSARLEIALAASDEDGSLSPIRSREVTVERAKIGGPIESAQLRFPIDVRLRKGRARVAAWVRDLSAQTESLVWAEVAVH